MQEVTINMEKKRASAFSIMARLIVLVKPLTAVMLLGIILGTLGHLCAIFVTVIAAQKVSEIAVAVANHQTFSLTTGFFAGLIIVAVMRGILHYGEQYCNHYIAFRILAIIRHKVFSALRNLCPAKLEGKEKGNLITVITTDIELLEVFFAHTISPIAIAFLTSLIMIIFIGSQYFVAGIIALAGYVFVGVIIPVFNESISTDAGMKFRNDFGRLNSYVLSMVYGVDENIQYGTGEKSLDKLESKSNDLAKIQQDLNKFEKNQRMTTNLCIQAFSLFMLVVMVHAYAMGSVDFKGLVISVVAMMGSFGPVVALSSLSNNLNQTLASGERVLNLLDEKPEVDEITDGVDLTLWDSANTVVANVKDISFGYKDTEVINNLSMQIKNGNIFGIHGPSGCGKSTLLRLLMRFWDIDSGAIEYINNDGKAYDVKKINTAALRDNQAFVTQETWISHDTIARNIGMAKKDATIEEIIEAAKKASIHEFVEALPSGYDTVVGESGFTLSGGERQRIGIARAFLHDANMMLLDEPTSSLDSLNEGIILKALNGSKPPYISSTMMSSRHPITLENGTTFF